MQTPTTNLAQAEKGMCNACNQDEKRWMGPLRMYEDKQRGLAKVWIKRYLSQYLTPWVNG
jgi:hypothetical protein